MLKQQICVLHLSVLNFLTAGQYMSLSPRRDVSKFLMSSLEYLLEFLNEILHLDKFDNVAMKKVCHLPRWEGVRLKLYKA